MKRRTVIFIMAIMLIVIACCLIYSRKDTVEAESAVYQDLLAEYERALEDPFYTREKWGNDVYEWLDYYMDEECPVRYKPPPTGGMMNNAAPLTLQYWHPIYATASKI